jgi:hypothetical protein
VLGSRQAGRLPGPGSRRSPLHELVGPLQLLLVEDRRHLGAEDVLVGFWDMTAPRLRAAVVPWRNPADPAKGPAPRPKGGCYARAKRAKTERGRGPWRLVGG